MRVPHGLVVLPLLLGALAGVLSSGGWAAAFVAAGAAAAVIALVAAAASLAMGNATEGTIAIMVGCALAGLSLGAGAARAVYHPPLLRWFETRTGPGASGPVLIEGVLREDAAMFGATPSLTLEVERADGVSAAGGVRLSVAGALGAAHIADWRAGRRLRLTAVLRRPSVYLDPGVRDERRALARRGVVLVGSVKSAALVEVTARGSPVAEASAAARAWTRARLAHAVGRWSPRSAAVATAVLIGDRTGLSEADTRRLQDAGTYHVIAISGGNIAILTALLLWLLGVLRTPSRAAAWITVALLLAYSVVVVPSASVQRAIAAAAVYLVARGLDQQGSALNVLAVAATLGIAASPIVLLDPGFLLSFAATIGILAAALRARRPSRGVAVALSGGNHEVHGGWLFGATLASEGRHAVSAATLRLKGAIATLAGLIMALLWTTVAAEAALLPIVATIFGRVTFAGLLVNFAAIPLMSILQALSMVALAVSALSGTAAAFCGYGAHLAAAGIVESARLTEYVPWLALDVVPIRWWVVLSYYGALLAALLIARRHLARAAAGVAVLAAAAIVTSPHWAVNGLAPPTTGVRVAFLDVGQGDATAIILPDGRAYLVDAGGLAIAQSADPAEGSGGFDVGARVVAPALRALGVRRLDAVAITHGDPDHLGGAPAIFRTFRPPTVWEGVPVPPHPGLHTVSDSADAMGLRWRTVQAGDVERAGPVSIRVLHPPLPDWERQRVRNEDSIVLDVRIGDVSIVLPGDIGAEGEKAILAHLEPARLVVFKAPHHGSATSSTPSLLAALRPAAVIFSAGRGNRFGHPAANVVARYRELGVAMFSTAEDGAVLLETDGKEVVIRGTTGRVLQLSVEGAAIPPA